MSLEEVYAIQRLKYAYGRHLDTKDFAATAKATPALLATLAAT